jgi:integrase
MALTAKRVAKLLRRGEKGRHLDARGMYLVIASRTAAHWERRYQLDGHEHYHGLGSAFVFSLAEARERNRRAGQLLADGVNPLDAKRDAKAARIAAAARSRTFGECAELFYQARAPSWRHLHHAAQWRASVLGLTLAGRPVAHDYCKILRPLPVTQIDTPIILRVLEPHWHDKPETMSRVRGRVESVLDYAKAAGYRSGDNPAAWNVIGKLLPSRDKVAPAKHFEAVPYAEVATFMAALRKREGTAARALEFLVLCAARSTEVREAVWSEIDFDEALWTIPAERMKGGKPHKIPLAPEAIKLLHGLYREGDSDGDGLLFLGPQSGKPLSDSSLVAVMRRMKYAAVPHGFRSSFSDWAHETTAYPNHVIEQSLAHSVGSAVARAYRRGDLVDKRRRLMTDWARFCSSPPTAQKTGAKIVSIGGRS